MSTFKYDASGMEEAIQRLQDASGAQAIEDIFTDHFISENTNCSNLSEFADLLKNLPGSDEEAVTNFISENTKFASLGEMVQAAMSARLAEEFE